MDKDALSANDWIKISIKFSGLCSSCKKKLNSGEYGYWSKLSKSVLHQSCYDSLFLPQRLPSPSPSTSPSQSLLDPKGISSGSAAAAADAARVSGEKNGKPAAAAAAATSSSTGVDNNAHENGNSIFKKRDKKIKCFICSRYVDFNNELMKSLSRLCEKYNSNSDIVYCSYCLENFDNSVYESYKRRFMGQIIN
jgi:hypothetical protein